MPKLTEIPRRRFQRFLEREGCILERIAGDHLIYTRSDLARPIVIQADSEIPRMVIKTNLRTLGLTTKQYLAKLKGIK